MKILGQEITFTPDSNYLGRYEYTPVYTVDIQGISIKFKCRQMDDRIQFFLYLGLLQTTYTVTTVALTDPGFVATLDWYILEQIFNSHVATILADSIK